MQLGSGDTTALLSGRQTLTHRRLMERFVSGIKPIYNAKASPIDALRTGAILEERYFYILEIGWLEQFVATSEEMNVLKCSIDFAYFESGELQTFRELKSCNFDDFLKLEKYRNSEFEEYLPFIKKKYKNYYNQVQQQLYCTGLEKAEICFLAVYTYEDEENYIRDIKEQETIIFEIRRDEHVIEEIKNRASIFQEIKNYIEGDY